VKKWLNVCWVDFFFLWLWLSLVGIVDGLVGLIGICCRCLCCVLYSLLVFELGVKCCYGFLVLVLSFVVRCLYCFVDSNVEWLEGWFLVGNF